MQDSGVPDCKLVPNRHAGVKLIGCRWLTAKTHSVGRPRHLCIIYWLASIRVYLQIKIMAYGEREPQGTKQAPDTTF